MESLKLELWPTFGRLTFGRMMIGGATFALLYYISTAIYCVFFHPLAKFPGPTLTKFSRLPVIKATIQGRLWQYYERLHAKYGSMVRIAPEELTTTGSAAWRDIYASKPLLEKDPYSQTPPINGANSLFSSNGEEHARLRKTMVNAFSDKALRDQSPIIETYAKSLLLRLRRELGKASGGKIDVAKYYGYAALDIVADLTYGESFYGLEGDNEHSWVLGFFLGATFGTVRNSLSRHYPLDQMFGWAFLRLTAKNRAKMWDDATRKIRRRLEMGDLGSERSDFITPVIGNVDVDKKVSITMNELTTNGLAVVIAGCQLSTIALSTCTYLLCRFPETLRHLTREVRTKFGSDADITVTSTQDLPYLKAVINEGLRMHHPTPVNMPRNVIPEGQMVDGHWIPGGTVIGVNLQNIHNDPHNWVEPGVFHPERFLSEDDPRYDSRFEKDDKAAFQPFSVGARNCIGGKVFLAEAHLIISKMIYNFDMELADQDDWSWMEKKAYLFFQPKKLMINLKEKTAEY